MNTILVVDDDEFSRDILYDILISDGFQPICVSNGTKALETLSVSPVDLIITDICMPEMDGFELAQNVREIFPDLRIIAVTGSYTGNLSKFEGTGIDRVIYKPFKDTEILDAVREFLPEGG